MVRSQARTQAPLAGRENGGVVPGAIPAYSKIGGMDRMPSAALTRVAHQGRATIWDC